MPVSRSAPARGDTAPARNPGTRHARESRAPALVSPMETELARHDDTAAPAPYVCRVEVYFSRHARRQMRWRRISETEVRAVLDAPDRVEPTIARPSTRERDAGSGT